MLLRNWIVAGCLVSLPIVAAEADTHHAAVRKILSGTDAAFLLDRGPIEGQGRETLFRWNPVREREALPPCSTFKIPNSAIALETGVAQSPEFRLSYDAKRDPVQSHWPASWARDHDLRSAISESVVWFYQEIARRIGAARMTSYLERFQYGNRDISGGIDRFWLGSSLRISAEQQVDFLQRFRERRLGISDRTALMVSDILVLEETPEYRWHGKTGSCGSSPAPPSVAWHVGWVERGGQVHYYALNLRGGELGPLMAKRSEVIRPLLAEFGLLPAKAPTRRQRMEGRIAALVAGFPGKVTLFARHLESGESFGIGEDEPVRTASTIKLPILVAVYDAVAMGNVRWDEMLTMRASDIVSGAGVLQEFTPESRISLRDAANLMIVVSDNTATNLILNRITAEKVNEVMDRLGFKGTRSLRKILGGGESEAGKLEENKRFGIGRSTPREMAHLMAQLAEGKLLSPEASKQILGTLQRQQYKDGIGRRLPDAWVASKSGALDALRSDVGLVTTPRGRIALAITVDGMPNVDYSPDNQALDLTARISRIVLDGLVP